MKAEKRYYYIFCLFILWGIHQAAAQDAAQNWINYSQTYYKIPIATDGIYRLGRAQLQEAGVPVNTIDPRTFQIYHKGNEIAILVAGESDGSFDADEYIEFIGKKNDGSIDTPLYQSADLQAHQYYNLFSDTTAYFLTWRLDGEQGKRMQQIAFQENTNNIPALSSFTQERLVLYTSEASAGRTYPRANSTRLSAFDLGEGFTGVAYANNSRNFVVDQIINRVSGEATIELLVQGRNNNPHDVEVLIGPSENNLRAIGVLSFTAFEFERLTATLANSDFNANGSIIVRVTARGTDGPDRISVSYIKVSYPRAMNMSGVNRLFMELEANSDVTAFELNNVSAGARLFDISDINNPLRLTTQIQSGSMRRLLAGSSQKRRLFVEGSGFISPQIKQVRFRNLEGISANYLIVSHAKLRQASSNMPDPIKAYAAYRASGEGGSYDTLTFTTEELFNQFNYGHISPLAIRNFVHNMYQPTQDNYLFLIGNGLNWVYNFHRNENAFNNDLLSFKDFVPPSGFPGSDALYSTGLDAQSVIPAVATGRLTARTSQEVENYLEKVKAMEARPLNNLNRKNHVILSGGLSFFEIVNFRSYSEGFKASLESPYLGGFGEVIAKRTNNTVETINIADRVNQGVQQITFFGHSGTQQTDIDIGFVSDPVAGYNNRDHYPFILINGCNAGEVFNNQAISFGEDWMVTANKGAIGVIAHSAEGFSLELRKFSNLFFEVAYGDSSWIYQTMGQVHREVMRRYVANEGTSLEALDIAQIQQMILQGDPAYRLFPTRKPDYQIANNQIEAVSLDGETITARSDSFALQMVIQNFGRTVEDTMQIQVNRILPSGQRISYPIEAFSPVLYRDTLLFVVNQNDPAYFGRNIFEVIIDPNQEVEEMDRQNNTAVYDLFLPLSGTINLIPYNNSIVNNTSIVLKAQNSDLFGEQRGFLLEMDTSTNFDSPWKQSTVIQAEVLIEWPVNLLPTDSTTYYWRTKFESPSENEITDWTTAAFTYIADGPEGWIQRQMGQFRRETLNGLEVGEDQTFKFKERTFSLQVSTGRGEGGPNVSIVADGAEYNITAPCVPNSINLLAFDRSSGDSYRVLSSGGFDVLDPLSCGRRPQTINQIRNNQLSDPEQYFHRYLDGVAQGDYVLLVTNDSVRLTTLVAQSRNELLNLGASAVVLDNLADGDVYILLGRKGMQAGEGIEITDNQQKSQLKVANQQAVLETEISVSFTSGSLLTQRIGPAMSWNSFDFSLSQFDQADDLAEVEILGVDQQGVQSVLFSGLTEGIDLTNISAEQFPYMRLRLDLTDENTQTPAQLTRWQVIYEEGPEGILLPDRAFYTSSKETPEGLDFEFPFRFRNISDKDYQNPLVVEGSFFNIDKRSTNSTTLELDAPLPGEEVSGNLKWITKDNSGRNNLRMNALPKITNEEREPGNNQFVVSDFIKVLPDSLAPVLHVTFDGVHIMDGDIVSPSPYISILLKDENPYLQKQDTTGISLFLRKPCDNCTFEPISLNSAQVQITQASDEQDFRIDYQPEQLDNGIHSLRVNVEDASNNKASEEPYTVNFEVINESTITHFYPYPNPFSTSTRFVFTLTGAEIPDEIKIQIMTVSGRVVREILQDEIGALRIGNNITDFAWDGTDEYGDQLANGVYLYRVMVRINGQYVDQRTTAADKAFTKGFGKLYILR